MQGSLFTAQIHFKLLSTLFCTFVKKIPTKHKATQSLGRPRHRWEDTVFMRVDSEGSMWCGVNSSSLVQGTGTFQVLKWVAILNYLKQTDYEKYVHEFVSHVPQTTFLIHSSISKIFFCQTYCEFSMNELSSFLHLFSSGIP
jgi:hypothetical protein